MKTFALLGFLLIGIEFMRGGESGANVISYYAVGNSLDGQLLIDRPNVLRFFPVFAMRDSVEIVTVTVYYGSTLYSRSAEKMDRGRYWQVILPVFTLGEAIQRLEVAVHFKLSTSYKYRFMLLDENLALTNEIINSTIELRRRHDDRQQLVEEKVFQINETLNSSYKLTDSQSRSVRMELKDTQSVNSLLHSYGITETDRQDEVVKLVTEKTRLLVQRIDNSKAFKDSMKQILPSGVTLDSVQREQQRLRTYQQTLVEELVKEVEVGLTDTMYSGPSVRKSDIIVDFDSGTATILYRNYKQQLRFMPALDPAERMGIFRVRYVPFPITGVPGEPEMKLRGPLGENPVVFEIGMAFGDAIVPGDEFVVPEFSFKRLGVAFAITEKLFNDDAEIIGLAITYDFNSYGSIGVGGNFAQGEVSPYVSFGINKKAFEAMLGGLVGLFE